MAYFPKTSVDYSDSKNIDAFGRLRTASPVTLFDSKQTSDDRALYWSSKFTLNATASYSSLRAATTLTASTSVGSQAIRQSRIRASYQPGKSLVLFSTQIFGPMTAGVTKRAGLFTDRNGIFLENSGSQVNFVLRSTVTGQTIDQIISQSAWNLDTLDGTGASGQILDITKLQILVIDLQWLGAGRVRAGFNLSGSIVYCHQFLNSNISSSVYMSHPDLPVRYEVANNSASTTGTIEHVCASIISEGGYEPKFLQFAADRAITPVSGVTNAGLVPVISFRCKANYTGSFVQMKDAMVFCTTNATNGFRWALVQNPQVGIVDNASWTSVVSSSVEYDVSRNSTNALTGGIVLAAGYGNSSTDLINVVPIDGLRPLGHDIDGNRDQIILAAQVVGGTSESFLGVVTWKEFA